MSTISCVLRARRFGFQDNEFGQILRQQFVRFGQGRWVSYTKLSLVAMVNSAFLLLALTGIIITVLQ